MSRSLRLAAHPDTTTYGSLWIAVRFGFEFAAANLATSPQHHFSQAGVFAASRRGPPAVPPETSLSRSRKRSRGLSRMPSSGAIGTQGAASREYSARRRGLAASTARLDLQRGSRPLGRAKRDYRRRLIDERGRTYQLGFARRTGGLPTVGSHHAEQVAAVGQRIAVQRVSALRKIGLQELPLALVLSRKYKA